MIATPRATSILAGLGLELAEAHGGDLHQVDEVHERCVDEGLECLVVE